MYHFKAKMVVLNGIFVALIILFTHIFAVQTPFLRISFGFLPLAVYAAICGPLHGGMVGAAADLLGCMLFSPGFYFPGFTLSAFFSGYVYGYCFYNKNISMKRIFCTFIFLFVIVDLFFNTLWLSMLYHKAAMTFLLSRFIKGLIFLPINIIFFSVVYKAVQKYRQKIF
ncbi:folate family ECF transporter S component [Pectinatus haikarae]|uniref:ECF transporter S component (Folate family) n=1 Tax=Pectinatus haikarae TaxID=349096 RepID=A0ABT9Y4L8_9FIRM|nr:folate family ECF transporter S component [Pectinatus haikarae]MDQ0202778.1 ECF transporter S component (folate family) [Pectinatus haikarae]